MTDHPLTDKMCRIIAPHILFNAFTQGYEIELECDNMRSAADWQLEQCIEELNGILSLFQLAGKIDEAERMGLLNVFKNAMRPQQEEKTDNTIQDTELIQRAIHYWEDI